MLDVLERVVRGVVNFLDIYIYIHIFKKKYVQWLKMGIDIMESKMYKVPRARPEKKHSKYKITIPFVNKALDFINVPQVLRSKETLASTPPLIEPGDIYLWLFSNSQNPLGLKFSITKSLSLRNWI